MVENLEHNCFIRHQRTVRTSSSGICFDTHTHTEQYQPGPRWLSCRCILDEAVGDSYASGLPVSTTLRDGFRIALSGLFGVGTAGRTCHTVRPGGTLPPTPDTSPGPRSLPVPPSIEDRDRGRLGEGGRPVVAPTSPGGRNRGPTRAAPAAPVSPEEPGGGSASDRRGPGVRRASSSPAGPRLRVLSGATTAGR
jgi:hypothetical protein